MRILKLLCVSVSGVTLMMTLYMPCAHAQLEASSCPDVLAELAHSQRSYRLHDATVVHHTHSSSTLSMLALHEKLTRKFPGSDSVFVLERLPVDDSRHLSSMSRHESFAQRLDMARAEQANLLHVVVADLHSPTHPDAVLPGLNTIFAQPSHTDATLLEALCRHLEGKNIALAPVTIKHDEPGTQLHVALLEDERQIGVISAWFDAHQTQSARAQRPYKWGGVALLMLLVVVLASLVRARRKRRQIPAWRELSSQQLTMCQACLLRAPHSSGPVHTLCLSCGARHATNPDVARAHHTAVKARARLWHMLDDLDRLARTGQRPWSPWIGVHQRVARHSALYSRQCEAFQEITTRLLAQWFDEDQHLPHCLGGPELRLAPYVQSLREALEKAPPEFARAHAPEPWMSHVSELYTLLDLVALELDLRCAPPASVPRS